MKSRRQMEKKAQNTTTAAAAAKKVTPLTDNKKRKKREHIQKGKDIVALGDVIIKHQVLFIITHNYHCQM